jgi:hypothetical protein
MEKTNEPFKCPSFIFAAMLYTCFAVAIGIVIGDRITQHYQQKRFEQKKFINLTCYDHKDINYIITGEYEFLKNKTQ